MSLRAENREARAAVILKPPRTSRDGRLKILDFGLAQAEASGRGRATSRVVVADLGPGTPVTYWASSRPWLYRPLNFLPHLWRF
jgi:hypothetical protein